MHILYDIKQLENSSIALGFFDAVHCGHEVVLKNTINFAKRNNVPSVVVTFASHPCEYLFSKKPELILSNEEKCDLLEKVGIDKVYFLDFPSYAAMKADDYIKDVLIKNFSPVAISTGFNHTFGLNGEGNPSLLRKYAEIYGFNYFEIPPVVVNNEPVSCSLIRTKLLSGDIYGANKLLGFNFFISGIVVHGEHIASSIGFPSANIEYPEYKVKIPHGVYSVNVEIDNKTYTGILNHGFGKTTGNLSKEKTEVHILDFNRDIYGKYIKISFVTKIRNQIDFSSVDLLKAQLDRDVAFARIYKEFENKKIDFPCKKFLM